MIERGEDRVAHAGVRHLVRKDRVLILKPVIIPLFAVVLLPSGISMATITPVTGVGHPCPIPKRVTPVGTFRPAVVERRRKLYLFVPPQLDVHEAKQKYHMMENWFLKSQDPRSKVPCFLGGQRLTEYASMCCTGHGYKGITGRDAITVAEQDIRRARHQKNAPLSTGYHTVFYQLEKKKFGGEPLMKWFEDKTNGDQRLFLSTELLYRRLVICVAGDPNSGSDSDDYQHAAGSVPQQYALQDEPAMDGKPEMGLYPGPMKPAEEGKCQVV